MVIHRKLLNTEKMIAADRISKDQTDQGEEMLILIDSWYTSAAILVYFTF